MELFTLFVNKYLHCYLILTHIFLVWNLSHVTEKWNVPVPFFFFVLLSPFPSAI
jgi:hypothetical protein